jgi:transposase
LADARKVKAIAPLACKTDRVDARVLADLARRDLVPEVWVPSLEDRANRERLRRRGHLVRLRTSARNRIFGLLTQWGLRRNVTALRQPGALDELAAQGVPEVWRDSISTLLAVIDDLDAQIAPLEREMRPVARADERVKLLTTIPGVGELLGLTLAAEIGDVSRFPSAGKLIGYSGLNPTVKQSGQSSHTGPALQSRPRDVALGHRRSRPTRLAARQSMAPPLHRHQDPPRQDRSRTSRSRTQDPHRRVAHPLPPAAVQAQRRHRRRARSCPGQLHLSSGPRGRLTN